MLKHINQINEQSFLLDFGLNINIETNRFVVSFANYVFKYIKENNDLEIKNCVPSYNKILIQFDPNSKNKRKILDFLFSINVNNSESLHHSETIEIPICYEDKFSLDIDDISKQTHLTKEEIIKLHVNTKFHVYMIGFIPGLPFMGDLDKRLSVPRKLSPRLNVSKGSVGIVNNLCVIYPNNSPGGWNIIGKTPLNLFFKKNNNPTLLKPGDKVKFKSISNSELQLLIKSYDE